MKRRLTVVYLSEANDRLIELWLASASRMEVTAAAAEIDRVLADDPFEKSVPLHENLWRYDAGPLRFYFTVKLDDRIVEITDVVQLPL